MKCTETFMLNIPFREGKKTGHVLFSSGMYLTALSSLFFLVLCLNVHGGGGKTWLEKYGGSMRKFDTTQDYRSSETSKFCYAAKIK